MLRNTGLHSHLVILFPKITWNELGQTSIHFTAASSMYHAPMIAVYCLAFPPTRLRLPSVYHFCPRSSEAPSPQFCRYPPWERQKPWQRCCSLMLPQLPCGNPACRMEDVPLPTPCFPWSPGPARAFIFHESLLKKNIPISTKASTCEAPLEGFPGKTFKVVKLEVL